MSYASTECDTIFDILPPSSHSVAYSTHLNILTVMWWYGKISTKLNHSEIDISFCRFSVYTFEIHITFTQFILLSLLGASSTISLAEVRGINSSPISRAMWTTTTGTRTNSSFQTQASVTLDITKYIQWHILNNIDWVVYTSDSNHVLCLFKQGWLSNRKTAKYAQSYTIYSQSVP